MRDSGTGHPKRRANYCRNVGFFSLVFVPIAMQYKRGCLGDNIPVNAMNLIDNIVISAARSGSCAVPNPA